MARKIILFFLLLCLQSADAFCQNEDELTAALQISRPDSARINIQLQLAAYYLFKPKEEFADLNTCERYLNDAEKLSLKLELEQFFYHTLKLRGALAVERKQYEKAEAIFTRVASYFYKMNPIDAAVTWEYYGDLFSIFDLRHAAVKEKSYLKAYKCFLAKGDSVRAAKMLEKCGEVSLNEKNFAKAEKFLLQALNEYKRINYKKKYTVYASLSELYYRKDEMQKRLLTLIELVNNYESDADRDMNAGQDYYFKLSGAYYNDKNYQKALIYYRKLAAGAIKISSAEYYYLGIHGVVRCLSNLKQYQTALNILKKAELQFKEKTVQQQAILISSTMKVYLLMNRMKQATQLISQFKAVFKAYRKETMENFSYYATDNYLVFYDPLPSYYMQRGEWTLLAQELKKIYALPNQNMSALTRIKLLRYDYKLDSAQGRSIQALDKFQKLTAMRDSMNTASNTKQINELEARYLSAKKDKTIEQLNSKTLIQKSRINNIHMQRNAILAGTFLSILLAASMYIAYRSKRKSNLDLKQKQQKINTQNLELSQVIQEKEKLLNEKDMLYSLQEDLVAEKEWLIKEIHHRVKNNLQIIMSLLYTQSAYLHNTDAVEAIRDVRNRVQAISIIHHKLYTQSGTANVVIRDYLSEMISYLAHSYNARLRKIKFKQQLSSMKIDIAQAVPIGLIVNEAITNAIKYAFGEAGGLISITSKFMANGQVVLSISDNGIGMPNDFKLDSTASLGMEMMKALTKQLSGTFEIINDNGVDIRIYFSPQTSKLVEPRSVINSDY